MNSSKKATSVDQQIALLEHRGMQMNVPIDEVKRRLLDIGYYRLGFYWHPFEADEHHNFGLIPASVMFLTCIILTVT